MQEDQVPVVVFLDMSKALGTRDHNILLDKLSYWVFFGISKDILPSHLSK